MTSSPGDGWRILAKASELADQGVEFALATVVWRQAPSSGQQGARAIITADGEIHGWVGGACAEPVVIREGQRVIAEGEPQLILLGAPEDFGHIPEGMISVPMACQSEGALQLYIEPVLSTPRLVVIGRSPMATTLVDLASVLGWRTELIDAADFIPAQVDADSIVIVATQGHDDEDTLVKVLGADPAFIGLVASKKRGQTVLRYLSDHGFPSDQLNRVRVPVGMDLGHTSHNEIAVAVLAELVALKASGEIHPLRRQRSPRPESEADTAVDLVCGMTVVADETSRPFEYEGTTYYFCAPGCRATFVKDPGSYIKETARAD